MSANSAGTNPPSLKIKLKPCKEPFSSQIQFTSPALQRIEAVQQQTNFPEKVDEVHRAEVYKRKPEPWHTSSLPSKRICQEESILSGTGVVGGLAQRFEELSAEPLLNDQLSRHLNASSATQREQQEHNSDVGSGSTRLPSYSDFVLENISHGQLQVVSVIPSSVAGPGLTNASLDDACQHDSELCATVDASVGQQDHSFASSTRPDTQLYEGHNAAVIPAHASWFAWDRVHKLEQQALPQLFFGKSRLQSPEVFMQARNAIITKHRAGPQVPMKATDISGICNLGDKDLAHILDFLNCWGLVNYQAKLSPERLSCNHLIKVPIYFIEDGAGLLSTSQLALTPLEYLFQYKFLQTPVTILKSLTEAEAPESVKAEDVTAEGGKNLSAFPGRYCSACAGDCSQSYFYCKKQPDYIICADCYGNGNLGIGMTTTEFASSVRPRKVTKIFENGNWSDHETLMLLEALEVHGDNWTEVSDFVGTKSKAQCISHFIGMSFGGRFLEDLESESEKLKQIMGNKALSLLEGKDEASAAFEEASNPVMLLVAFLAAIVGPRVAAVAAQAALSCLSEECQAIEGAVDGQSIMLNQTGQSDNVLEETLSRDIASGHQLELSEESTRKIMSAALARAAMKAKLLADQEDREVQRLVAVVVDNQLKKLTTKLKELGGIDAVIDEERNQMEKNRQQLSMEWLCLMNSHSGDTAPVC
eukprot:c21279_g1_i1 orf=171-2279(+)